MTRVFLQTVFDATSEGTSWDTGTSDSAETEKVCLKKERGGVFPSQPDA